MPTSRYYKEGLCAFCTPPIVQQLQSNKTFEYKRNSSKGDKTKWSLSDRFEKTVLINSVNETSTTDELSQWKPSVNKSRLPGSNKITTQI